jgi:osmotically-inducible protein OsmY
MLSVFLALSVIGCAGGSSSSSGSDRGVAERTEDQALETRVKAALLKAPDVSGASIQVEVLRGEVQLSGFVKSKAEVQRAIDAARSVSGVRNVINKRSIRS